MREGQKNKVGGQEHKGSKKQGGGVKKTGGGSKKQGGGSEKQGALVVGKESLDHLNLLPSDVVHHLLHHSVVSPSALQLDSDVLAIVLSVSSSEPLPSPLAVSRRNRVIHVSVSALFLLFLAL